MEYAGYIPVEGLEISGLTDKIANKVFTIGQEREAKRQELADLTQKTEEGMFIPMTDNNALNGKIGEFTGVSTDYLYRLNKDLRSGKITPAEYKRRLNTLDGNVAEMKKMADQYDKRIQEAADRIEKGEAGVLQAEQIRFMDAALNLNNSWGLDESTGKMYMLTPEGRKVYADWINKDGNLTSRKIDLVNKTNDYMKNWSAESIYERFGVGGSITYESLRSNEAFDRESNRFADMMVQGDNLQSIILDNGVIDHPLFAYSEEQTKQVVQEEIDRIKRINNGTITQEEIDRIENSVVFMDKNGKAQFTDKQIEMAKDAVKDAIRIRTAEKAKLNVDKGFNYLSGQSTSSDKKTARQNELKGSAYKAAVRAMQSDPFDKSAMSDLNKLAAEKQGGRGYSYKFTKDTKPGPDGLFGITVVTSNIVRKAPSKDSDEFKNSPEYEEYNSMTPSKDFTKKQLIAEAYKEFANNEVNFKQIPEEQERQRFTKTSDLMRFLGYEDDYVQAYETGLEMYPDYEPNYKRYMKEHYYPVKNSGGKPKSFEEWRKGGTTQGTTTNNNSSTVNVTANSPI